MTDDWLMKDQCNGGRFDRDPHGMVIRDVSVRIRTDWYVPTSRQPAYWYPWRSQGQIKIPLQQQYIP